MSGSNSSCERLLNAIGGIDDKYIEEAVNYKAKANKNEKAETVFAEPNINILKRKRINAGKWVTMAAAVCIAVFAVLIFTRTYVVSNRLGDTLPQMDSIDSLNVTVLSLAEMGTDTLELTQLDRNFIASYIYELEKNEVNDSSIYSEMPEGTTYRINIVYKNGGTLEIDIQMNGFYFVDRNGQERADLYRDKTDNYSRLTEYINKIVYDYKVNAYESGADWENIQPDENGVIDKDYLDGYIAELEAFDFRFTANGRALVTLSDGSHFTLNPYIKAAQKFNLRVTLPDGLECTSGRMEGTAVMEENQLCYVLPECYTDAVKILKLRQGGSSEYVLMHWCQYSESDGLYTVRIYSLDRNLYNSGSTVLVGYTAKLGGEPTDCFILSRDASFDGENGFTDITSGRALTLDIASHTAEVREYDPDIPVFSEAVYSDFDDHFALEPFQWNENTPFSSENIVKDNKYYYIYADSELNEHARCNWGINRYDFETGETTAVYEQTSYELVDNKLLAVYDKYTYFMSYWRDLMVSEEQFDRVKTINRHQESRNTFFLLYTMVNNEYREYFPEGSPCVQIDDCLYYVDRFDPDQPQRQFIFRLGLGDGESGAHGGRVLFMDDASKPTSYKNGIIYYKDGGVYYVENPNGIDEYLGSSAGIYDKPLLVASPDLYNDGGALVADVKGEKLFDLRLDDEGGDILCTDGENIYFLDGYKKFAIEQGVRQDKEFCNFGVFKEENGEFKLQPIANFDFRTNSLKCANGLIIIDDRLIYDPEKNVLAEIPRDRTDIEQEHMAVDSVIIGGDIVIGTYRSDGSNDNGKADDTLVTYRIVKK